MTLRVPVIISARFTAPHSTVVVQTAVSEMPEKPINMSVVDIPPASRVAPTIFTSAEGIVGVSAAPVNELAGGLSSLAWQFKGGPFYSKASGTRSVNGEAPLTNA